MIRFYLTGEPTVSISIPTIILSKITMMRLIITPPILIPITKQHRIRINIPGGHNQRQRQRALDFNRPRRHSAINTPNLVPVRILDNHIKLVRILTRIWLLVLRNMERTLVRYIVGLHGSSESATECVLARLAEVIAALLLLAKKKIPGRGEGGYYRWANGLAALVIRICGLIDQHVLLLHRVRANLDVEVRAATESVALDDLPLNGVVIAGSEVARDVPWGGGQAAVGL
jgi:hypothetical protein